MAVCFAVFSPRLKSYSVYSGPKPPIKSNKFSGRYILRVKRLKRIKLLLLLIIIIIIIIISANFKRS